MSSSSINVVIGLAAYGAITEPIVPVVTAVIVGIVAVVIPAIVAGNAVASKIDGINPLCLEYMASPNPGHPKFLWSRSILLLVLVSVDGFSVPYIIFGYSIGISTFIFIGSGRKLLIIESAPCYGSPLTVLFVII